MMKKWIALVLAVLLMTMPFTGLAATSEDAKQSVVRMYVEHEITYLWDEGAKTVTYTTTGSGFAVGKRKQPTEYFVTNRHVVSFSNSDAAEIAEELNIPDSAQCFVDSKHYIILTNVHEKIPVSIVALGERADLAVVQSAKTIDSRKPIKILPVDAASANDKTVYTLGFPGTAEYFLTAEAADLILSDLKQITKTTGIITRVFSHAETGAGEILQTNAESSGGNSGGPVVDEKGNLIGVHCYGIGETTVAGEISSNELIRLLDDERIPYEKANGSITISQIALIILAALIVLVLVLIILQNKKQPSSKNKRYLVGTAGHFAGKRIPIKGSMKIGRAQEKCQIVFPKDTAGVSMVHCTVRFDGKTVTITDENSSYGIAIDGRRIKAGQSVVVHRGQVIQLGSKHQTFTLQA